ncbi:hypothetical protein ALQ23_200413 [Pseudomonas syringae pv. antirrhini]|nr:hypothetical protein ALQ23_200413 [Pseudomonas syringae pv. antirrhini]
MGSNSEARNVAKKIIMMLRAYHLCTRSSVSGRRAHLVEGVRNRYMLEAVASWSEVSESSSAMMRSRYRKTYSEPMK